MAREDLAARGATALAAIEDQLRAPTRRWVVVGGGLIVTVGLHALTGDERWAWLAAVPVVVGGIVGGGAFGLAAAAIAAFGHAAIDVAGHVTVTESIGILVRSLALLGLGVIGAVVQRIERQRDTALVRSATEDPVTGLLNVRAFYDGLAELRRSGKPFSILLADVVGMRALNEQHGHNVGTEALRALGHALRRSVKAGDLVARLGSDEMAIALGGADHDGARAAAARLATILSEESLFLPDGQAIEVHAYFGIATYPDHADDEITLLRAATHAVVDAKNRGPDEVAVTRDAASAERRPRPAKPPPRAE